jgi:hypothetical protein
LSVVFAAQTWVNDASTTSFGDLVRAAAHHVAALARVRCRSSSTSVGRLRRRGALRTSSIDLLLIASVVVAT